MREDVLQQFATSLRALHTAAGEPSYAALHVADPALRRSTVSDALRGKSLPGIALVLAFVRACDDLGRAAGHPLPVAEVATERWERRWHAARRALADQQHRPPHRAGPQQLPRPDPLFVGRAAELRALEAAVRTSRAVLLHGPPGAGKTALALRWAESARHRFRDGQLFADLGGFGPGEPADPATVLEGFLQALDVPLPRSRDAGQLAAAFRSATARRRVLVVLDDAAGAAQVRPLLPAGSSCTLVTSRPRLRGLEVAPGGVAVQVGPLPVADAVAVLRRAAGSAGHDDGSDDASDDASDTAAEEAAMAEVARLCGGLPLALRLAGHAADDADGNTGGSTGGSTTTGGRFAALARRLRDERTRVPTLDAAVVDHEVHLNVLLDRSLAALEPPIRRQLAALAVHPGAAFSFDVAAALCGEDPAEALTAGMEASLVEAVGEARYRLPELVRSYLAGRDDHAPAGTSGDAGTGARTRMLSWYLHSAQAASLALLPQRGAVTLPEPEPGTVPARFPDAAAARAWFDLELPNLVAATAFAERHGAHRVAAQLPVVLLAYFNLAKTWTAWVGCFRIAVASARAVGDDHLLADACNGLGIALRELRDTAGAETHLAEASAAYERAGNPVGAAMALNNLGNLLVDLDRATDAVLILERARALIATADEPWRQAIALNNLAEACCAAGRADDAASYAEEALRRCSELSDQLGRAYALSALGQARAAQQDLEDAAHLLAQAAELSASVGDDFNRGRALYRLALVCERRGARAAARRHAREALAVLTGLADPMAADVATLLQRL